jgi:hypothetical protein
VAGVVVAALALTDMQFRQVSRKQAWFVLVPLVTGAALLASLARPQRPGELEEAIPIGVQDTR